MERKAFNKMMNLVVESPIYFQNIIAYFLKSSLQVQNKIIRPQHTVASRNRKLSKHFTCLKGLGKDLRELNLYFFFINYH